MITAFTAQRTLYLKPAILLILKESALQSPSMSPSCKKSSLYFTIRLNRSFGIVSPPDDSIETQSIEREMHMCYHFTQIVLYRASLH